MGSRSDRNSDRVGGARVSGGDVSRNAWDQLPHPSLGRGTAGRGHKPARRIGLGTRLVPARVDGPPVAGGDWAFQSPDAYTLVGRVRRLLGSGGCPLADRGPDRGGRRLAER